MNHIVSRWHFRDADIHVEFMVSEIAEGNSGIYIHGNYEMQIFNSYGKQDLNEHADDGVAQEDDDDAAEEGRRALDLLPLEEEPEGPLQADDESEAAQKQDLENKSSLVNQKPGRSVPSDTVVILMT